MRKILSFVFLLVAASTWAQGDKDHNFKVAKNLDVFNAIYKNLDMMYVDTLDADEVVGTGIRAMLRSLDPYTEYYPEDKAGEYKQMMTGKYAGIGAIISYSFTRKRVVINEHYENRQADDQRSSLPAISTSTANRWPTRQQPTSATICEAMPEQP